MDSVFAEIELLPVYIVAGGHLKKAAGVNGNMVIIRTRKPANGIFNWLFRVDLGSDLNGLARKPRHVSRDLLAAVGLLSLLGILFIAGSNW